MNQQEAMKYLNANRHAVLATNKRNGRPQMSPVDYGVDSDGMVRIQVTEPSAKVKNVRRDPRVSLTVLGEEWLEYVVIEGTARLLDDDRLATLRDTYQMIARKPHPDWDEFNQAMVDEQQIVMAIEIERFYPLSE